MILGNENLTAVRLLISGNDDCRYKNILNGQASCFYVTNWDTLISS